MLKIRFKRMGKNKQPFYRVIINENHKDPFGDVLENLGNYNPRSKEAELKADRIKEWISKGAEVSDSVWNLLIEQGIVEGKKRTSSSITKKRTAKMNEKNKKDEEVAEASKEEVKSETPVEEKPAEEVKPEVPAEESAKEEIKEEKSTEEAPKEESKEEKSVEEDKKEESVKEEAPKEEKTEEAK